jgi:hypothetical protein
VSTIYLLHLDKPLPCRRESKSRRPVSGFCFDASAL